MLLPRRTKRSRRRLCLATALGVLLVVVAAGVVAATEETTTHRNTHLRSLQSDHRTYVYMCRRRDGDTYYGYHVAEYDVAKELAAGGGYIGETVPDKTGGTYIFNSQCTPMLVSSCWTDTKTCPNGQRTVERDPDNGCAFRPCPQAHCCDANERLKCESVLGMQPQSQCCPTGRWACPGLFGSYYCGAELGNIRRNFGPVCAHSAAVVASPLLASAPSTVSVVGCDACGGCGYFDGCNSCTCAEDGNVGCTTRWCPDEQRKEPYCYECQAPPPPPPPPAPVVSCSACGGCGFYDGCNSCTCDATGNVGCTNRWCPDDQRGKPYCYECSVAVAPPPPPPPAPTTSCTTCPCGFFDGCNTCACNPDGTTTICTLRACSAYELEPPRCNECNNAPTEIIEIAPAEPVPVDCDICPCGYYDGCNECGCQSDGTGFCSRMYCDVYKTPFCKPCSGGQQPRATARCPADTRTCPDGRTTVGRDPEQNCSFRACPVSVTCPSGYRMCGRDKWVALDPRTNCQEFYPCD